MFRSKDHPIDPRHNDAGDLEVTITLPRLRPLSEWRSDDYGEEIVLVVDPGVGADEVEVSFAATAEGYCDIFAGESFTVPVTRLPMLDVVLTAIEAKKAL
jgi:hypothetical protein